MKRVSVIGCSGSGKSTLSRTLHERTGLPLVHLDRVFWNAGWVPSEKEAFRSEALSLCAEETWIIDGHYYSTMDERFSRADTVIYLDFPTLLCLRRTLSRMIRGLGRDRPDCSEGCPERINREFLQYVAKFRRAFRDRTLKLLEKHPHLNIHVFKHPKELERYLASLPQSDS